MVRIRDIIILIALLVKAPFSAVTTATFLVAVVRRNTRTVSLKTPKEKKCLEDQGVDERKI
jgi:hypothetical protein